MAVSVNSRHDRDRPLQTALPALKEPSLIDWLDSRPVVRSWRPTVHLGKTPSGRAVPKGLERTLPSGFLAYVKNKKPALRIGKRMSHRAVRCSG